MSGVFPENASFLRETFLSWVPRGKLRCRNKQIHHGAKPLERHRKKEIQRKHYIECLIRFRTHKKPRLFSRNSFLGFLGQNEEHWKPARPPRRKTF